MRTSLSSEPIQKIVLSIKNWSKRWFSSRASKFSSPIRSAASPITVGYAVNTNKRSKNAVSYQSKNISISPPKYASSALMYQRNGLPRLENNRNRLRTEDWNRSINTVYLMVPVRGSSGRVPPSRMVTITRKRSHVNRWLGVTSADSAEFLPLPPAYLRGDMECPCRRRWRDGGLVQSPRFWCLQGRREAIM